MDTSEDVTPIGTTNFRNTNQPFGIKQKDRFQHIYAIGKSGTGKSTLLLNMALSDIQKGNGLCVIDPHGDVVSRLLDNIPQERLKDLIYINPKDVKEPVAFNPLYAVNPRLHHIVVSGLIGTFRHIWAEFFGPRMEHILRHSIHALLHYPRATILDIVPLLTDSHFRDGVLCHTTDTHLISFWKNEFERYTPTFRSEAIAPILNKVGIFATNPILRAMLGQHNKSINMQQLMDQGKIVLVDLSKGEIGEDVASLIGSMLVSAIQLGALARSAQPEHERRPFFLYVDEMHSFITLAFVSMLSEARKYKLGLFLTHQYLDQVDEKILAAILGNCGTIISFRVGSSDGKRLAEEFYPIFSEVDLINLPSYHIYLKLLIDSTASKPFSAITEPFV